MRYRASAVVTVVACACALFPWNVGAFVTSARWAVPAVVFFFNPQNSDVSADAAETALLTGMHAWHAQSGADFQFIYGGRTSTDTVVFNNRNELFFRDTVADSGPSTIATTYTWSNNGWIIEADIVFWDGAFTFVTGTDACPPDSSSKTSPPTNSVTRWGSGTRPSQVPPWRPLCPPAHKRFGLSSPMTLPEFRRCTAWRTATTLLRRSRFSNRRKAMCMIPSPASAFRLRSPTPRTPFRSCGVSSIDGYLGSLTNFNRSLSVGTHVITAVAIDNGGLSTSRSVTITVSEPGTRPAGTNVARDTAGATATSSGSLGEYLPGLAINGDRTGFAFWHDRTFDSYPDFVRVDFATTYTIGQVNVIGVQDTWPDSGEPAADTSALAYGLRDFECSTVRERLGHDSRRVGEGQRARLAQLRLHTRRHQGHPRADDTVGRWLQPPC